MAGAGERYSCGGRHQDNWSRLPRSWQAPHGRYQNIEQMYQTTSGGAGSQDYSLACLKGKPLHHHPAPGTHSSITGASPQVCYPLNASDTIPGYLLTSLEPGALSSDVVNLAGKQPDNTNHTPQ